MLSIRNIHKTYDNHGHINEVIRDASLEIPDGQFVSIVGPSGSGKTTLLKIIAGLIPVSSGGVYYDGVELHGTSRQRGVVFQQFSLFPWLNVFDNASFGLKIKKYYDPDWREKTDDILQHFGLADFKKYYPKDLSGGMQQRVAVARTLLVKPKIILMDEPFGSLDALMRIKMQEFITAVHQESKTTIIFVTHDTEEAVFLADQVYVLKARPTTIKAVYKIPFSQPRPHSLKISSEFFELKNKITEELEEQ